MIDCVMSTSYSRQPSGSCVARSTYVCLVVSSTLVYITYIRHNIEAIAGSVILADKQSVGS